MSTVTFRPLTDHDFPLLEDWLTDPACETFLSGPIMLMELRQPPVDGDRLICLIAEDHGQPVALLVIEGQPGGHGGITVLCDPARRRQGHAAALITHAVSDPSLGFSVLIATVHQDNTASRRLFTKLGFEVDFVDADGDINYLLDVDAPHAN